MREKCNLYSFLLIRYLQQLFKVPTIYLNINSVKKEFVLSDLEINLLAAINFFQLTAEIKIILRNVHRVVNKRAPIGSRANFVFYSSRLDYAVS